MNIQYIRLDDRVCEILNKMALEQRRTVSEVVNEILSVHLQRKEPAAAAGDAVSGRNAG